MAVIDYNVPKYVPWEPRDTPMSGEEIRELLLKICDEFLVGRSRYIQSMIHKEKVSLVLFAVATGEGHGGTVRADVTSLNFPGGLDAALRDFILPSIAKELDGKVEMVEMPCPR
jgi:hypothetical protein